MRKQKNTQLIIHQIYIDIGKYEKIPDEWVENMEVNKKLNRGWRHILWDENKIMNFVNKNYPEYKKMINSFPEKFYLIDFSRYLILKKYGGIYIDLDVRCRKAIPKDATTILGDSKGRPNNNVMRLLPDDASKLLDYSVVQYDRVRKEKLYEGRPIRRLFWSVGAYMFKSFIRENKIKSDISFKKYFKDAEAKSWLK
tara:strand:+ start:333 stop:923 length:591 start_codon:yes stop_codon:yes gene_type:complete